MKNSIFTLIILFSTLIFAQNSQYANFNYQAYNDVMNYIPENLKSDSIHQLDSPLFKGSLNTIVSLKFYCGVKRDFEISENDSKWFDARIEQLATELFKDGKKILISAAGGAGGCPENMLDTIQLKNFKIIDLKFCYSCTETRDVNFIDLFNQRMYSLMKIEPPDYSTSLFYGKFIGLGRKNKGMKLELKKDRTFKFWLDKGHTSDFTEGFWKNKNDTLILNSRKLNRNDSLFNSLSNSKWIEFNQFRFRFKREKLFGIKNRKKKLKKFIE